MNLQPIKKAIAVIKGEHYKTEITTQAHSFLADEPSEAGGKDLGPAPGDFLRTSLASCTAITLRMYADRKKYSVDEIQVEVSSETIENKTIFHRSITIQGSLTDEERKRLESIADKCPTHKALTNPIEIQSLMSVID